MKFIFYRFSGTVAFRWPARFFRVRHPNICLNLSCIAQNFHADLNGVKHGTNERYNSANYAEGGSRCIGTKEGQVRTWVKKDSYHGDVVRATNPCKAGEFGSPGWRVRITTPPLSTIDQTSHITASSTRSLEAWANNSMTQRARTSRAT